ncbi:hypothetical protein KM043_006311 [Ampulex compressa]|nr:hypothetical protein KM043_006311 [Ampulex compressa]
MLSHLPDVIGELLRRERPALAPCERGEQPTLWPARPARRLGACESYYAQFSNINDRDALLVRAWLFIRTVDTRSSERFRLRKGLAHLPSAERIDARAEKKLGASKMAIKGRMRYYEESCGAR